MIKRFEGRERRPAYEGQTPFARQAAGQVGVEEEQRPAALLSVEMHQASVLIAEDNVKDLQELKTILHERCEVKFCDGRGSAAHLLGMLAAHPKLRPDLILLDIQIPEEDGYLIIQQIHSRPILQNTKIVALVEDPKPEDLERARQARFEGLIGKPIDHQRFPEQIRRILLGEAVWEP